MREEREEGGTPGILGDIKLGLVVLLKQSFGERNLFFMAFLSHYAVFSHDFSDLNSMKVVSILPALRILLLLVTFFFSPASIISSTFIFHLLYHAQ